MRKAMTLLPAIATLAASLTVPVWAQEKPLVVATTTMIADLLRQVGGDKIRSMRSSVPELTPIHTNQFRAMHER